jgi:hypothetical protein
VGQATSLVIKSRRTIEVTKAPNRSSVMQQGVWNPPPVLISCCNFESLAYTVEAASLRQQSENADTHSSRLSFVVEEFAACHPTQRR